MLQFLQYLIALVIAESADPQLGASAAAARPDWTGIALAVAAFALATRVVGVLLGRATASADRGSIARFSAAGSVARIAGLFVFHAVTIDMGGARIPAALGIDSWLLVPRLVQLAPYLLLVAAMAWGLWPATAAMRVGPRTAGRAVADEFRHAALPLLPVVAVIGLGELSRLATQGSDVARAFELFRALPALQAFGGAATVFAVLLAMPFAMRFALRAKPLPDGPLRQRLMAYSKRVRFRFRDILVWPTDGDVINAAVLGALPRFRYVLVTDALLTTLDEDEIEAVFAHEAGHARRGHVLLFLGFTSVLGLIGFVPGIARAADFLLSPLAAFPLLRLIVLLGVWLGVVFGWISRRFEQEADVFGLETLPTPGGSADPADHPFARAMERIGGEVGAIREVTGWRHFSIADRVAFVRSYLTDENVRRAYRRSILLLRGSLLLVIGGFALSAALQVPSEVLSAVATWRAGSEAESKVLVGVNLVRADPVPQRRGEVLWRTAGHALLANRGDDALRWLRESVALDPRNEDALAAYANLLERTGRPAGARLVWEELAAREDLAPERRDAARRRAAASGSR